MVTHWMCLLRDFVETHISVGPRKLTFHSLILTKVLPFISSIISFSKKLLKTCKCLLFWIFIEHHHLHDQVLSRLFCPCSYGSVLMLDNLIVFVRSLVFILNRIVFESIIRLILTEQFCGITTDLLICWMFPQSFTTAFSIINWVWSFPT